MSFPEEHFTDGYVYAPRLIDIIHNRSDSSTGSRWSAVGFDKLVIPASCTYVTARFATLTERFNERYMFRRINQESLERWQIRLQNKMDEIVEEMDRAYALYTANGTAMSTDVSRGSIRTLNTQNKLIDTPDSAINASDSYADSLNKQTGTVTDAVKGQLIEDVNRNIDAYRDIDTFFISQFENNFLNVFD